MYKIYYLVSKSTNYYYIGMTKNTLRQRLAGHRHLCNKGKNTHLYNCMRKYKDFQIVFVKEFGTRDECVDAERRYIAEARKNQHKILNVADGGESGFVVPDKEAWRKKLKKSRAGAKPALGMKHTEENKKLFSEISKKYWSTQKTYNAEEVCSLRFRDAHKKYGISKTHYYRLRRKLNEEIPE